MREHTNADALERRREAERKVIETNFRLVDAHTERDARYVLTGKYLPQHTNAVNKAEAENWAAVRAVRALRALDASEGGA